MPISSSVFSALDISTRPKRRRAVLLILTALSQIHNAEEAYLERIPMNLKNSQAYAAADYSIDLLTDAIITLMQAY